MKNSIILFILFLSTSVNAQMSFQTDAFNVTVKGKGETLILIPGLACSGDVWNETVEVLSKTHECHVLTLAGFAGQAPLETPSLKLIRDEIIRYIKANNLEKPKLIGHSLGGFLSMWIGSLESNLIGKILIVDSLPFLPAAMMPTITVEQAKGQANMMKNMMLSQNKEQMKANQKMSLQSMITNEEDMAEPLQWSLDSDKNTVAESMYELMTTDLRETIASVEVPMLVLGAWYAGKDFGMTEEGTLKLYEGQYAKAKNCKVKMAATAKHFIMLDEFDWFINEALQFIGETEKN